MMLDLIAIGDVTIDTFIELDAIASLQCNRDHQHCSLCIPFETKLGVSKGMHSEQCWWSLLHCNEAMASNSINVSIVTSPIAIRSNIIPLYLDTEEIYS